MPPSLSEEWSGQRPWSPRPVGSACWGHAELTGRRGERRAGGPGSPAGRSWQAQLPQPVTRPVATGRKPGRPGEAQQVWTPLAPPSPIRVPWGQGSTEQQQGRRGPHRLQSSLVSPQRQLPTPRARFPAAQSWVYLAGPRPRPSSSRKATHHPQLTPPGPPPLCFQRPGRTGGTFR